MHTFQKVSIFVFCLYFSRNFFFHSRKKNIRIHQFRTKYSQNSRLLETWKKILLDEKKIIIVNMFLHTFQNIVLNQKTNSATFGGNGVGKSFSRKSPQSWKPASADVDGSVSDVSYLTDKYMCLYIYIYIYLLSFLNITNFQYSDLKNIVYV